MSIEQLAGQRLGHYEICDLIGAGGMGAVYRAYEPGLDRYVAIKVLPPAFVLQADYIERFDREVRIATSLRNAPHIVPIYYHGIHERMTYIVMQLLEGGSLAERLAARPRDQHFSLDEVADLLRQLAAALDYAHNRGVIHRDIKPGNVMFDAQGKAYLVDFGIAKFIDVSTFITQGNQMLGTPSYMSPEQCLNEELSPASDQYALAVLVYRMLTGHLPVEADTPFQLMYKQVHQPPTPVHDWRPDLPHQIADVLGRALAKDAGLRFSSVNAFAEAFDKALNLFAEEDTRMLRAQIAPPAPTITLTDTIETHQPELPSDPVSPPPRRKLLVPAAFAGMLCLTFLGGMISRNPPLAMATAEATPAAVALLSTEEPTVTADENDVVAMVSMPSDTAEIIDDSPTATVSSTSVPTHTPEPTDAPTNTPQPTDEPTHTPVPPSSTPQPSSTPMPTNTPEPTATFTFTPLPTLTHTAVPTATATPPPTNTPQPVVIDLHSITFVTYGQYRSCRDQGDCTAVPPSNDLWLESKRNQPVLELTWRAAQTYCEAHNSRLLTEAEWEQIAAASSAVFPEWVVDDPSKLENWQNTPAEITMVVRGPALDAPRVELSGNRITDDVAFRCVPAGQ